MKTWYHSILTLLAHESQQTSLPVSTVFAGTYLPEHKLFIHFVSLDTNTLRTLAPDYFSNISALSDQLGIRCVHVWEDVYSHHSSLVEARLLAMIGQRQRIHARSTEVVRIDKNTCEPFLQQHHLQGSVNAYYKYALLKGETIVAVATFSKSRVMQDGVVPYRSCELIRFASLTGYTVTGGLSKLISRFMDDVKPAHLMTYADRDWGDGAGYRKLGFVPSGISEPLLLYVDPQTKQRYSSKQTEIIPTSWIPIHTSGSIKYVLDKRNYNS
jgi:hypothetical protein